jgi:hypothetical protein
MYKLVIILLIIIVLITFLYFLNNRVYESFDDSINYDMCLNEGYPYKFCVKTYGNEMNKKHDCYLKI